MTNITVSEAQAAVERAQRTFQEAIALEATKSAFGKPRTRYVVNAKVPDFSGPFVSYPEQGIAVAVFEDGLRAHDYVNEVPAPAGYALVVDEIDYYG